MITGVSFVGIAVNDLEEAQGLFENVLGLRPWDQGVMELPGARAVMLPLGDCSVELLQPTVGPEAPVGGDLARWLAKRGESLCRLGLWVDDVDQEVERIGESGVQVVNTGDHGRIGEELGTRMAFVHPRSTHGVLIELDQRM